jgi:hypothetical protein
MYAGDGIKPAACARVDFLEAAENEHRRENELFSIGIMGILHTFKLHSFSNLASRLGSRNIADNKASAQLESELHVSIRSPTTVFCVENTM